MSRHPKAAAQFLTLAEFRRLRDEMALQAYLERLPHLKAQRWALRRQIWIARLWRDYTTSRSERIRMDEERTELFRQLQPIDAHITAIRADIPRRRAALVALESEVVNDQG